VPQGYRGPRANTRQTHPQQSRDDTAMRLDYATNYINSTTLKECYRNGGKADQCRRSCPQI
jgi:hypothetical protein